MKRYLPLFISILTVFSLFFAACSNPTGSSSISLATNSSGAGVYDYSGLQKYKAWANDITNNSYYEITVARVETGSKCEAWIDTSLTNIQKGDVQALVSKFDNEIYSKITSAFGKYENIFQNPNSVKLILMILDIKDGYNGDTNKGFVGGYFDPMDLSSSEHSNGGPILYIDANPQKISDSGAYKTVAHEFQHLINYANSIQYRRQGSTMKIQDTWINEGLSTAAEYLYQNSHPSDRVNWFNADPLGTIARGNNFYVWETSNSDKVLDDYASAYLFFQWLRIHSNTDIYKAIGQSSSSNYTAVTSAAAGRLGVSGWDALLSTWLAANSQNDSSGLTGYKGQITTRVWAMPQGSYSLYPGEAVYTTNSAATDSRSGGNTIKKLTRDKLVMYNATPYDESATRSPAALQGALPGGSTGEPNAGVKKSVSAKSAGAGSGSYQVDAWTVRGRENEPRQLQLPAEANAVPFTFRGSGSNDKR